MKKHGRLLGILAFVCLTALLLGVSQALLVPHDKEANPEAFLLHDYIQSDAAADEVVFVGDCEVYEAFSPVTLWQEYGVISRVCGSPQQLLWHSYAVLNEVFERSDPRVIVMSVYGLCYGQPQSEAYNRMALDALPWSAAKWQVVRASLTEGESALSYLFPLLRYHGRWSQLTWRDVTTLLEPTAPISSRGYLMQTGVMAAQSTTPSHEGAPLLTDATFGAQALDYFDRIVTLCRQNGAQLVLIKAPTDSWRYPWYEQYEEQVVALAEEYGLPYYNFLNDFEDIGLDLTRDTYDAGLHLNVYGAEKLSVWFGQILIEQYELTDGRRDASLATEWQAEVERYEKQKAEGQRS